MSTQNRKNANSKKPVSSHPLFPAIIALWFGALFGLGSLAVRVSLIESLIISSHIDVLVPMAAPPLGMTARILIALFMAMIGIGAGAAIARRIARPKKVAPNRRRTAGSVSEARQEEFVRQAQAQQEEQRIATEKADAVRRRALASGDTEAYNSHHDLAPLPGGAPQILDVTQFDLAAPGSFETDLSKPLIEDSPLDLTGFAPPQTAFHETADSAQAAAFEFAEPEQNKAPVPVLESYGDDTESFRASFANVKKPAEWTPEPPLGFTEHAEQSELASNADHFGIEPADLAAPRRFDPVAPGAEVQPQGLTDFALGGSDFAAPAPVLDLEFAAEPVAVELAEFPEMPAAAAMPELRRFDGPASAAPVSPDAGRFAKPVDFVEPTSEAQRSASEAPAAHTTAPEASVAPFLPQGSAAERIASADLTELSPVELVERFALALKQRRHTGVFPAGLFDTAAALDIPVRVQPSQVPEVLAAMAPVSEPMAAPEPVSAPVPAAAEAHAVLEVAVEPEADVVSETSVAATPLFAAATAAASEIDDAPVAAFRLPLTLPTAMRPIEFGHQEEHDDLPDYVPPRSFAMPRLAEVADELNVPSEVAADVAQQEPAPVAQSVTEVQIEPPFEAGAEPDVNEEGYSSLLALSRSAPLRQTFVRIEEPTGELSHVEPVVIFPGQATRPGTRFSRPSEDAAPVEATAAQMPSFADVPPAGAPALRRFDAPAGSAPTAAAGASGVQDPAEAERALRSALATLQRMSGAA